MKKTNSKCLQLEWHDWRLEICRSNRQCFCGLMLIPSGFGYQRTACKIQAPLNEHGIGHSGYRKRVGSDISCESSCRHTKFHGCVTIYCFRVRRFESPWISDSSTYVIAFCCVPSCIHHRGWSMSLFGDFEYHLQISVGIYIPNSWVMFNWDIYQPLLNDGKMMVNWLMTVILWWFNDG